MATVIAVCSGCSPAITGTEGFVQQPIDIASFGLFDLGVADINNDSRLDIFTVNHSGRQSLLVNKGGFQFEDMYSALGFDQDKAFPGLVVTPIEPPIDKAGLYVYWRGPYIVVRAHGWKEKGPISGTIELLSPVKIGEKQNFTVNVDAQTLASGIVHTKISFSSRSDADFSFKPYIHALPITFRLDSGPSADHIYVGPERVSPSPRKSGGKSSAQFTMNMRDRHGTAWSDFNGDGLTDVFITRGGQRGWMSRMPGSFWDELLLQGPDGFKDVGEKVGLTKDGCSGRQAAWVDYNNDGRLDLYVVCGKDLQFQPNQLYRQTADGRFVNVAKEAGLDIGLEGSFVWVDADNDGDMDLFWANYEGFYLYRNDSGKFTKIRLGSNRAHGATVKLSVSDFDGDGDLDIFAASLGGNSLCVNVGGTYVITDPTEWGLPANSAAANWVDYDNDGVQDLHTIPQGLYRQYEHEKFKPVSALRVPSGRLYPTEVSHARVSWFDADNNGTRDVILALDYGIKGGRLAHLLARLRGVGKLRQTTDFWQVAFFRNTHTANHWLEVKLVGPPGNRPAIGGRVTVVTPGSQQMQQVGGAEGSQYSQGHYRLYFGLGRYTKPELVRVQWPDGHVQEIKGAAGDQLLVVRR